MSVKSLHKKMIILQQVQEIQNRLAGDVTGSKEYQILLNEKSHLEETLGYVDILSELTIFFFFLHCTFVYIMCSKTRDVLLCVSVLN